MHATIAHVDAIDDGVRMIRKFGTRQESWTTLRLVYDGSILDTLAMRHGARLRERIDARASKMKQPRKRTMSPAQKIANVVHLELDESALLELIAGRGEILPSLLNAQDNIAVHRFSSASIGSLPVDRFGQLLCKPGETFGDKHIIAIRLALIRVYFRAAHMRLYARAARCCAKTRAGSPVHHEGGAGKAALPIPRRDVYRAQNNGWSRPDSGGTATALEGLTVTKDPEGPLRLTPDSEQFRSAPKTVETSIGKLEGAANRLGQDNR